MKRINIRKKLIGAVTIATAFLLGVTPMAAFAQSNENAEETEVVENVKEQKATVMEPEIVMVPDAISEIEIEETKEDGTEEDETIEEAFGPLSPEGNMTLVDDYGTMEAGGKQFITVVTKSGNYFYIIIDRDDQGNETVHFLNMVDESDLISLMDDEEAQVYSESITTPERETKGAEVEDAIEENSKENLEKNTDKNSEVTTEVAVTKGTTEKSSSKTGLLVLILVATIGGIAGYMYLKNIKTKDTKNSGPDPDTDYTDEEEDFLSELPEEEFQEEREDNEIIEEHGKE